MPGALKPPKVGLVEIFFSKVGVVPNAPLLLSLCLTKLSVRRAVLDLSIGCLLD